MRKFGEIDQQVKGGRGQVKYGLLNKVYENVYKLKCRGVIGFNLLSKFMLKLADPIIRVFVNLQPCYIHFSHQGVYYMYKYPAYDRNIGKICQCLKETYRRDLSIVDVGANVGDTILCIGDRNNYYYAFEGEKRYYSLLEANLKEYNYKLFKIYCGDAEVERSMTINYKDGTGRLVTSGTGNKCIIRPIDSVLADVEDVIDFVKIDTDGFDFAVIRGMNNLLNKFKPVLYFEWTAPELIKNNENLISAFQQLSEIGYNSGVVFDKFGNLLCTINVSDFHFLKQLIEYSLKVDIYYDVCLVHSIGIIDMETLMTYLRRKSTIYE